ncbi:Hypothetical protein, putative [Bodo saltans]|uniref:Uncharacterized protein n=1 Tax=Bodo saltans TaxID=75058 RepID=A0A0S4KLI0_BODSA|nr:Hypothetical protein, putative [Bodo saltans]|eukprot:CUI15455.1 Hypothetical protein, putative [Bodo saltans]
MVGTPSLESLGHVSPVKSTCSGYIRPLSASSTSSVDECIFLSANIPRASAVLNPSTCVVFVPPNRSALLAQAERCGEGENESGSDVDDRSSSCLSRSPSPSPVRLISSTTAVSASSHLAIQPCASKLPCASQKSKHIPPNPTVMFRLPYMTTCSSELLHQTIEDKCATGHIGHTRRDRKQRRSSQDDKTGPMSLSQTSVDRRNTCVDDIIHSSSVAAVNEWRRPTLYRGLETSQELKMAISFDNFRHSDV